MNNYQNHPLAGATDLDSAFNKLWSFYKKYFLGLYLISVVSALLTSVLMSGIDIASLQAVSTDPQAMLEMMKSMAGPYALTLLVALTFGVLLHVWVLEKPLNEHDFVPSLLKKTLIALVPYLVTMIMLGIITSMAAGIGLILLVLPGLFAIFYMATVMLFAMPVTLVETLNPFDVIGRSFKLMHRNLWPNMGWVIVVILILIVVVLLLSALVMLPFTGSFIRSIADPDQAATMLEIPRNPVYIGLNSLTSALVTPLMPILAFILYFRNRGEEVTIEATAENDTAVRVEDLYPPMPGRE